MIRLPVIRLPDVLSRLLVSCLVTSLTFHAAGCATIVRGTTQTVHVATTPPGRTVMYQGVEVADGDLITVRMQFEPPRFNVGDMERPVLVDMTFDPDPLLIADAAFLLLFVVPGLVALGVDFSTGAWRNLHYNQHVYIPEPSKR